MKEWQRTVILVIFLVVLIGVIIYSRQASDPRLGI
jgi:hypothetical protein